MISPANFYPSLPRCRIDEVRQLLGSGANVNSQDLVRINMEPLKFVFFIVLLLDGVVVVVSDCRLAVGVEEVKLWT